jgi:hypothetical protein
VIFLRMPRQHWKTGLLSYVFMDWSFFDLHKLWRRVIADSLLEISNGAALSAIIFGLDELWSNFLELLFSKIAYIE